MSGKFEGCQDQDLAEYLNGLSLDGSINDELGDVQTFGWYGLLLNVWGKGKMKSYIISEDEQGFFSYDTYDTISEARIVWDKLEAEYEIFQEGEDDNG